MTIRESVPSDYVGLMTLYTQLHGNPFPPQSEAIEQLWSDIQNDPRHHIIVAVEDEKIVSSCVCVIVPNLTHGQQPYALIENVITDQAYRKQGLASACLHYARDIAKEVGCYKMMLLTGSKDPNTLSFYRKAGYNSEDKTAFIQWL